MFKILIHGAMGQMGQVLQNLIDDTTDIEWFGFDTSPTTDKKIYDQLSLIPSVDVIIDFSHFTMVDSLLNYSVNNKLPLVLCTTGLSDETQNNIIKKSQYIPIFKSENMSLGVQALLEMAKIGAEMLKDYDIEIIEKHHNKKIDAPSGTAKMILNSVIEIKDQSKPVYGRQGNDALRNNNDIGIHAIRGGNITGEHNLIFAGLDEVIEIKHQATSKSVFGQGAIAAAKYIIDKEAGMYTMLDLFRKDNS